MKRIHAIALLLLLAGCAAPGSDRPAQAAGPGPIAATDPGMRAGAVPPVSQTAATICTPEVERLKAQLATEVAERQRLTRAAALQEETLRRQLEAFKSAERGILQREERIKTEKR